MNGLTKINKPEKAKGSKQGSGSPEINCCAPVLVKVVVADRLMERRMEIDPN